MTKQQINNNQKQPPRQKNIMKNKIQKKKWFDFQEKGFLTYMIVYKKRFKGKQIPKCTMEKLARFISTNKDAYNCARKYQRLKKQYGHFQGILKGLQIKYMHNQQQIRLTVEKTIQQNQIFYQKQINYIKPAPTFKECCQLIRKNLFQWKASINIMPSNQANNKPLLSDQKSEANKQEVSRKAFSIKIWLRLELIFE